MFNGINQANYVGVSLVNKDKTAHIMLLPYDIFCRLKAAAVQILFIQTCLTVDNDFYACMPLVLT